MSHPATLLSPRAKSSAYVIGVDGGGTGTRARLARADGTRLGDGEAGPSGLGQGIDQAWTHVRQAIDAAFRAAGLEPALPPECAVGLGLAGVELTPLRQRFLRAAPDYAALTLDTDAHTAVLGAHAGRPGVVVAAGTGSVGEAIHPDGRRVTAGGWGFAIGDEGSGAWLGLRAMRLVHRALDGRADAGPLARTLMARCGADRETLLSWAGHASQHAHAALAPLVFDHEEIDPAAAALIADAVDALEELAAALDPDASLPLVIAGSLGRRLEPRLSARTRARCVAPAGDAADGALALIRLTLAEPSP